MIKPKSQIDIFNTLKKKFGEPRQDIWDEIVNRGYISEAIQDGNLSIVFDFYKEQNKRYSSRRKTKTTHKTEHIEPPDERLIYLSNIIASDLNNEPLVIEFRREVLDDRLIDPSRNNVDRWMKTMANTEHGDIPSNIIRYVKVRLPAGVDLRPEGAKFANKVVISDEIIEGSEYALISYCSAGDNTNLRSLPVPIGGVLERLYNLSKYFTALYPFSEAHITYFILTGVIPRLPLAQTAISQKTKYPEASTVSMKISQHLSPEEVKKLYVSTRKMFMGENKKRDRSMTKKHLELAEFYHNHKAHMKGKNMMQLWNGIHTEFEPYTQESNFGRDAKQAEERLVGRKT